jgi:DNA-binding transcriptional MocR family regulator
MDRTSRANREVIGMPTIVQAIGSLDGPGTLHGKLAGGIRRAIDQGDLALGTRLPSERELARQLALSRSTVVAAYDALRAKGILVSRQGSGTVVATGQRPATRVSMASGDVVYRALVDEPSAPISLACAISRGHQSVAEAIAATVAEDLPGLLELEYLPAGLPALRRAVAAMYTDRGTPTAPEQIMVTCGAQQAIDLIAAAMLQPGDVVVAETPNFGGTLGVFRSAGARLHPVAIDREGVDDGEVARVVERHAPALVYLMPSFHNPTGISLASHRRRRLAEMAASSGVTLVEDNVLENSRLHVDPPPPIAAFAPADAPVVTIGSLSKVAWGGLRIGWVRAAPDLVNRLARVKALRDLGSPLLDQAVAARLLDGLDALVEERRRQLLDHHEIVSGLLRARLPEWTWEEPDGGMSLWIRLPSGDAASFASLAGRYGVEVVPGDLMTPDGHPSHHFRLPFTAPPAALEETVERLASAWRAYARDARSLTDRLTVVV